MVKGLYTAYTGMINEQNRMDIMTNNLANASTVGYKKEGSTSQSFDDVLTVKIKDQSVSRAIRMILLCREKAFLPLNLRTRPERQIPNIPAPVNSH